MTVLAWFGMNDLSNAKASFKEQSIILEDNIIGSCAFFTWQLLDLLSAFSAAFPMVIKQSFPEIDPLKLSF